MAKDNRSPEEVNKTFLELTDKCIAMDTLDKDINAVCNEPSRAESFAERKANARRQVIEVFGTVVDDNGQVIGKKLNPDATDSEVNSLLGGRLELAREEQVKYYTENLDAVLEGIPSGNLEKMVLAIEPQKIADAKHDDIYKLHKDFKKYANMLEAYAKGGDIDKREELMIRMRISEKQAKDKMKDKGIKETLNSLGKKEKDIARSLLYWAFQEQAYRQSEGDREEIVRVGRDEILQMRGGLIHAALDEAKYAKKDYALVNLKKGAKDAVKSKNPEAIQNQIYGAYSLSKAA